MSEYTPIPVRETSPGSFTVQFPKNTMTGKFEREGAIMTGHGYTPTTEEIRDGYSWSTGGVYHEYTDEGFAEFDRWFAEVERQAKAEAWEEGYVCGDAAALTEDRLDTSNPYRGGSDE